MNSFDGNLVCFDGIHGTNPYEFVMLIECLLFYNWGKILLLEYRCSCLGFSMKNKMCEHIHTFTLELARQYNQENLSVDDLIVCEEAEVKFEDNIDIKTVNFEDDHFDAVEIEDDAADHITPPHMKI